MQEYNFNHITIKGLVYKIHKELQIDKKVLDKSMKRVS